MKAAKSILFILVVIGLIWLIFILFSRALGGGGGTVSRQQQIDMVSYANTDAVASMYVDGPINANEEHQAYRITVSREQTRIERISGYENNVVREATFPSNTNAYADFLKSLERAEFDKDVKPNVTKDERGFCPLRSRYIFAFNNSNEEIIRSWTTGCGGGNMTGSFNLIKQLFIKQVPDKQYNEIMRGSRL